MEGRGREVLRKVRIFYFNSNNNRVLTLELRSLHTQFVWYIFMPGTIVKQITNLAQLGEAIKGVDEVETVV